MRTSSLRVAAAALLGCVAAAAQPPPPAVPPDAPRYQIEIIVFANNEFDRSEERFPQRSTAVVDDRELLEPPFFDAGPLDPLALPDLPQEVPTAVAPGEATPTPGADVLATDPPLSTELVEPVEPVEPIFRSLLPDELQLQGEYQRLSRLPAYTPLLHAGWVQAGLPEDQAPVFDLAMLGNANPRGTVRLYLSRFLHVNLDITYQTAAGSAASTSGELDEFAIAPRYTLVTERNVRSGELHYFDHPAFGVLVKITPQPAQPAASSRRPPA